MISPALFHNVMSNTPRYAPAWLLCVFLCMFLSACEEAGNTNRSLRLAPCSAEGSEFAKKDFEDWKSLYRENVDAVIESHMQMIKGISGMPLQCTAQDYRSVIPASPALKKVAEMLPAWKERASSGMLSEADMSAVMLEFLRVYECSMSEHLQYLPLTTRSGAGIELWDLTKRTADDGATISRERAVARVALERTLSLTGGFDRLLPLSIDIECLKRSSLDMRNTLGLASDISSCLPRIWDAKGSLRDAAE